MTHALTNRKQSPEHVAKRVAARFANGTYTHSENTKKLFSEIFSGRKHTDEWKKNMSKRMKENHPMKGKTHSIEARKKMSLSRKGVARPHLRGENAPTWRGGKTKLNIAMRRSLEYRNWREIVYKRDDYTCQSCGVRGGELNPDHVLPMSIYPELAFDPLNGRTLCRPCHKKTDTFGVSMKSFEPSMTYLILNHS